MADIADVGRVPVLDMSPGAVAVLQVDRPMDRKEADQIRAAWRMRTGRDCVLIPKGVRLTGVVDDVGTPIFDRLLEERRKPGAFLRPRNLVEVIAPSPRMPVAGWGR